MMMNRQKINDYVTAALALIVLAVVCWYVSTSKTSVELKKLQETQQNTDSITKEVKDLAAQNKVIIEKNNIYIKQKTDEARTSVPDDTDSLIDLANDIIRNSDESGCGNSADVSERPEDSDNRDTGK